MAALPFAFPSNPSVTPLDAAGRALFEHAPIGMVLADLDGRFLEINPALRRILDWPVAGGEAVASARWEDFLEPGQPARNLSWILAGLEGGAAAPALQTDAVFRTRSGRLVDVQWNLCLAPAMGAGQPGFQIGQVSDIGRRKAAERKLKELARALEQSNQDLQQFAYAASHDLQEPLRMVRSYLELLARRYRGRLDADADEFIGYAVDGAARMQKLIAGLLTYSRVGSDGKQLGPVRSGDSLAAALGNLQLAIAEAGAVVDCPAGLPEVLADSMQLTQLFQNLVANAVKFRGAEAPSVHIGVERRGDFWRFAVRDNGIGVDPNFASRIFQIFQRLEPGKYPGSGIGLALAKRIVERHGGQIGVEAAARQGAEFWFTVRAAGGNGE